MKFMTEFSKIALSNKAATVFVSFAQKSVHW